jgi:hypothetical protein
MLQLRFVDQDKPPVWLVEKQYILGSASDCNLPLRGAGVQARHAELAVNGDQLTLTPLQGAEVAVDGRAIFHATALSHNCRLQLGSLQLLVVDPKKLLDPVLVKATDSADWCLLSTTAALANRRFPITGAQVLGRASDCDISLAMTYLSRRHARLWLEDGSLWLEDLNSANGTYVNGERVKRAQLNSGDKISFDTLVFTVIGPLAANADSDKTSLRPSLNPVAPTLSEPPVATPKARPALIKDRVLRSPAPVPEEEQGTGWPLLLGIASAGLLTVLVILYLLS